MSLAVSVASSGVRAPLGRARVANIARLVLAAEGVRAATLSIAFVSARHIARLNEQHLGHTGATDVIAFGFAPRAGTAGTGEPIVGDIYIAPDVARRNAARHGIGVREEIARLVVHGALHVLGHNHPHDGARAASPMWRRQEALLSRARRRRLT